MDEDFFVNNYLQYTYMRTKSKITRRFKQQKYFYIDSQLLMRPYSRRYCIIYYKLINIINHTRGCNENIINVVIINKIFTIELINN